MFLCRPALLECWVDISGALGLGWGRILGNHGVLLLRWWGSCLWVLVLWPFRGVIGWGGAIFLPFCDLSLLSLGDWYVCPSFLWVLSNTLKLWGLAFRSLSQGAGGAMGGLGLVYLVLVFRLLCLFFLRHSLIGLQSSSFCFMFFLFGSLPMPVLEIEMPALHFRENMTTWGTMGEQCCALNGLPRFVNKSK